MSDETIKLPMAETVSYWKSGGSSPDAWLEKTAAMIAKRGGQILGYGFGIDEAIGRSAYLMQFRFKLDAFRIVWPILPTRNPVDEPSARRQAATMLYHDVKAKLDAAQVLGARRAFFSHLLLPNGKTVVDLHAQPLALPSIVAAGNPRIAGPDA